MVIFHSDVNVYQRVTHALNSFVLPMGAAKAHASGRPMPQLALQREAAAELPRGLRQRAARRSVPSIHGGGRVSLGGKRVEKNVFCWCFLGWTWQLEVGHLFFVGLKK